MDFLTTKVYTHAGRNMDFAKGKIVYNLGSGSQKYKHVIGVDCVTSSGADMFCDLDTFPWAIESNSADVIFMFHSLEHLDNQIKVMEELHRIAKPGATIVIEVPHFRSVGAFADPTHRHFFSTGTMNYYASNKSLNTYHYVNADFILKKFWLGWPAKSRNPITRFFKWFINRYADFYDKYLSLLAPVRMIVFELEVVK